MPAPQTLLFPDPRPLVERLGEEFFRRLPECPGVYLMQDASGVVLYVGKAKSAKSLRQRLGHYRVANPDRMGRRPVARGLRRFGPGRSWVRFGGYRATPRRPT